MYHEILTKLGLTKSQAQSYLTLVKFGKLTPPELATKTGESRTAAYMALDKLEEIGLATKEEEDKKLTYKPINPNALEKFIKSKREQVNEADTLYRRALPSLLSYYYSHRDEPGIRFFEGIEGLKKVYADTLREKSEEVLVFRTTADLSFGDYLYEYMEKRAKSGKKTKLIGPYTEGFADFWKKNAKKYKGEVTMAPPEMYTSPVEIQIYGEKVSIISFGEEATATIIESPQIAEAMRQIFHMAKAGAAHAYDGYKKRKGLK